VGPSLARFLDAAEHALETLTAEEVRGSSPSAADDVTVASGGKRLWYLALAGGSFALALVALAVPGLPTVPCLLATSYYLARSSPRLEARLMRTAFFGPILQEWEGRGALSLWSKSKLAGLTLAIVTVTVVLAPLTPVNVVLIVVVTSVSLYGIARMPGFPEESLLSLPGLNGRARLSLPAP
jgi:uncharacterized membrane protein YbaN (DUF454 family)